jgi:hypothetical protein
MYQSLVNLKEKSNGQEEDEEESNEEGRQEGAEEESQEGDKEESGQEEKVTRAFRQRSAQLHLRSPQRVRTR